MLKLKQVYMEQAGAEGAAAGGAGAEGGAEGGAAAAAAAPWFDSFEPDVKNFAAVKQWKDPSEAVRSFMNAEKLLGVPAESVIKMPKAEDTEAWGKVYDKLGRPAKAEEYNLPVVEGDDGAFAKIAADWMHKAGLNTQQAQALAKMNNEYAAQMKAKMAEDYQAKTNAEQATLKTEWGAAYEKKTAGARAVAKEFGITGEVVDAMEGAMGFAGVMRFMDSLAAKVGEDKFVSGSSGGSLSGVMTPDQAKGQITALKADAAFTTKYLNGDAEARARMNHLHKMAYPDPA